MKPDEFKCGMCGFTYQKEITDEESRAEAVGLFGKEMLEVHGEVVVCDDCFQKISPVKYPAKLAKVKNEFYKTRN